MPKSRFTYYWLPVLVYCVAIFIQSSFPTAGQLPQWSGMDKLLHVAAYALLGFLFFRALAANRPNENRNPSLIISILLTGLYGLSDEFHQSFVPGRTAEAADALADLAGGVLGAGWGWMRAKRIDKTAGLL